jgi:hypothetical protein
MIAVLGQTDEAIRRLKALPQNLPDVQLGLAGAKAAARRPR